MVSPSGQERLHYAKKAKMQQFTRRKPNLIKKVDQLARLCHADVALIIRRNERYYTYRSTDHIQWPPPMSEIVRTRLVNSTQAHVYVSLVGQSCWSATNHELRDRDHRPLRRFAYIVRKSYIRLFGLIIRFLTL